MSELEWFEQDHEWDRSPEKVQEWTAVVEAFQGKPFDARREWARAQCPLCVEAEGKEDAKESLGYHSWTGKYNCFKCGCYGFLPISFRKELSDDPDAVFSQPERPKEPKILQPATGFQLVFDEPGLSSVSLDWARRYLTDPCDAKPRGRGLTPEVCRAAQLGAAIWGPLGGRVIVPIPDYSDPERAWKGWVGRAVFQGEGILPYRYPKGFDRLGLVYNEPALYRETKDPVYIVEGCFDALSVWPDGVAVLGKPLESQMPLFLRSKRPIAVALDGDAYDEAQALAWNLQHRGKMAYALKLPPKKDPDDLGKAWLRDAFDRLLSAG